MSNAAAESVQYEKKKINIEAPSDPTLIDIQVLRSLQDSIHDNQSCLKHEIIKKLYKNKETLPNEKTFIEYSNTIPNYIENLEERQKGSFKGIFTPTMECLVNDTPQLFEVDNSELTFIYDMGAHPINYFKKSKNGIFISDAIDTAPKLTNPSQRPLMFETPDIVIPGSYIGFDENVVKSVSFSGFRNTRSESDNYFECKVVIQASLNDGKTFRWYDLASDFKDNDNKLIGYTNLNDALKNAKYKASNARDVGFFIGNKKAATLLEDTNLNPILALCLVVAKLLGDFSTALAASPTLVKEYMIIQAEIKKFIQASGDRLSIQEGKHQGANTLQTLPRNENAVIVINYTPGTGDTIEIDYQARAKKIEEEILKRFDDLLEDVEDFNIYKYKVDGDSIDSKNDYQLNKLTAFVKNLETHIKDGKLVIEKYIESIQQLDPKIKYETLFETKSKLMPQSPTICMVTTTGKYKSLNVNFHLYTLPDNYILPEKVKKSVILYLKVYVYNIIKTTSGGKLKFRQKRIRRTPRKSKGGMDIINTPTYTPPGTPPNKKQRIESPLTLENTNNSEGEMTDDSQFSGISTTLFSEQTPRSANRKTSYTSDSQEVDPTVQMDFPLEYYQNLSEEKQALQEFEKFMNEIRDKVIQYPGSDQSTGLNDPIRKIANTDGIKDLLEKVKKNTVDGEPDYDEGFMKLLEEEIEQIEKEKEDEEVYDSSFIEQFKSIKVQDEDQPSPTGSSRKRKRNNKTYRRIKLF